jgi:hypothetical protein
MTCTSMYAVVQVSLSVIYDSCFIIKRPLSKLVTSMIHDGEHIIIITTIFTIHHGDILVTSTTCDRLEY